MTIPQAASAPRFTSSRARQSESNRCTGAQLAAVVADHVDADADDLRIGRCATGKHNETYFVDGCSPPLVLRVAPPEDRERMLFYEHRMMHQEPALHERLARETVVPVPEIVAFQPHHPRLDRDLVLMARLPGKPLSEHEELSRDALRRVLSEVGQCLRQVHEMTGPKYGYVGGHEPMEPQEDWANAFRVMWNKLLDDIDRCGGYLPEESTFMRRLLDAHLKLFERTVEASLLHMDVWAQNILADDAGQLTGLLDWDRALWGDPEIEFAVLDYCGISEPAFWEGYGRCRDTSRAAEIRRVFYLLYELQKYIFIRRVRRQRAGEADRFRCRSLTIARSLQWCG